MPSKQISWASYRVQLLLAVPIAVLVLLLLGAAQGQDDASRERLRNLSVAEQEELRRKSETFESLDEAEQDRMRELHVAITSSPDSDRLQSLVLQYHEWLKTLTAKDRADLLSLPPEKRINQIKKLMEEQRQQRFQELVRTQLSPEDVRAIFTWLDTYAKNHEEELMALLPETTRARVTQPNIPRLMQRKLMMMALGSRGNEVQLPPPTEEELESLRQSLSENARKALLKLPQREQQLQLVRQWLRAAFASRMAPQISRERLLAFYREYREKTNDKQRVEEIDSLPHDEFYEEVKKLYYRSRGHWRGRRDGDHRFGPHKGNGTDRDRDRHGHGERGRPSGDPAPSFRPGPPPAPPGEHSHRPDSR